MQTLDQTTEQALIDAISAKVANNESFTALDISRVAQSNGVKMRHGELRDFIHRWFFDGKMTDYRRTSIPVSGTATAWVYHHQSMDPYAYRSQHSSSQSAQQASPAPTPSQPASSPAPKMRRSSKNCRIMSSEGRLHIPHKLLDDIGVGAGPGAEFYAHFNGTAIIVSALATIIPATKFKRTARRDCRLSADFLRDINFSHPEYIFRIENSTLIIEKK